MNGNIVEIKAGYAKDFSDLQVYKAAYILSLEIHRLSLSFPKVEQYALADQLRRVSKSICANLAEGFARQTQSSIEFRRYVTIALGSANEMRVWISYSYDLGYIDQKIQCKWLNESEHITRMLRKLQQAIKV